MPSILVPVAALKRLLFIIVTGVTMSANGQDGIRDYVARNTIPISSIDPGSVNYADLEALGEAVGNAQIVMLGEQDHGDAPTFLAKTRIIKYLHEKKGFNVLAFESDFFGLNHGWDKIEKNKQSIDTFLRRNIFPVWTYCYTCTIYYTITFLLLIPPGFRLQ